MIPCYNEEKNIIPLTQSIIEEFDKIEYDYEILFSDNASLDKSREILRHLCNNNKRIKAIFNSKNFGMQCNLNNALMQAIGDAVIYMAADFQDPPELIGQYIKEWEQGFKIVVAVRTSSAESKKIYRVRKLFYSILGKLDDATTIRNFNGTGLYDREFIELCRKNISHSFDLRTFVGQYGARIKEIEFVQPLRKGGKTSNNISSLIRTSVFLLSKKLREGQMYLISIIGFYLAILSAIVGLVYFILKLCFWNNFTAGIIPIVIASSFILTIQFMCLGFIGKEILLIQRYHEVQNKPFMILENEYNMNQVQMLQKQIFSVILILKEENCDLISLKDEIFKILSEKLPEYEFELFIINENNCKDFESRISEISKLDIRVKSFIASKNPSLNRLLSYSLLKVEGVYVGILYSFNGKDCLEQLEDIISLFKMKYQAIVGNKNIQEFERVSKPYGEKYIELQELEQNNIIVCGMNRELINWWNNIVADNVDTHILTYFYLFAIKVAEFPININWQSAKKKNSIHSKINNLLQLLYSNYFDFIPIIGLCSACATGILAIFTFISKFNNWNNFVGGITPLMLLVVGGMSLQLIGISSICCILRHIRYNITSGNMPLVRVEEYLNFTEKK